MRHWTIGMVQAGAVTLTTDTGVHNIYRGQQFFTRPYEPHSLQIGPASVLTVFCFGNINELTDAVEVITRLASCIPALQGQKKQLSQNLAQIYSKKSLPRLVGQNCLLPADSIIKHSIQAVIHQIQTDPENFSGIEQIATYAGYSQWYFLRAFQKFTGNYTHNTWRILHYSLLQQAGIAPLY